MLNCKKSQKNRVHVHASSVDFIIFSETAVTLLTPVIISVKTPFTFHDSDWVLHLRSKDIWSEYSGEVLDAHFVLVAVGLDLIEEP